MKMRVIICVILSVVAQSAIGQVSSNFLFRYRSPIANDSIRCDLTPLFAWWAEQMAERTNQRPDQQMSGGTVFTTNTAKPMEPWFHITGPIAKDDPQGWIVDATVETAPGKGTAMRILLIHPPRKEQDRFSQKVQLLNNPLPTPDYSAQEAEIKAQDKRAFIANTLGDDDLESTYAMAAAQAEHELDAQKKRDQSTANERTETLAALGDFPADWQTYRVDIFALNTGRQLNGLPVFDAGLSFSK